MKIIDYLDITQLEQMLQDWSLATGLAATIVDSDGEYIAKSNNFTTLYKNPDFTPTTNTQVIQMNNEPIGKIIYGQIIPNPTPSSLSANISVEAAVRLLCNTIQILMNANEHTLSERNHTTVLHTEIEHAAKLIQEMNEKSLQLDKIENKQNILSLNASIEAARSGEFGRGFSVVATEVGKLAVSSGEINKSIKRSLKELTKLIEELERKQATHSS